MLIPQQTGISCPGRLRFTCEHTFSSLISNMSVSKDPYAVWLQRRHKLFNIFQLYFHYGRKWVPFAKTANWTTLKLPLRGKPEIVNANKANRRTGLYSRGAGSSRARDLELLSPGSLHDDPLRQAAVERFIQLKRGFSSQGKFRYRKPLGFGSCGVAILFEELEDDKTHKRFIVAKGAVRNDGNDQKLIDEWSYLFVSHGS
jgi:hypothetical protein